MAKRMPRIYNDILNRYRACILVNTLLFPIEDLHARNKYRRAGFCQIICCCTTSFVCYIRNKPMDKLTNQC